MPYAPRQPYPSDVEMLTLCLEPAAGRSDFESMAARVLARLEADGWSLDAPPYLCEWVGCFREAGCGTPTPDGYRMTCGEHVPQA